MNMKVLRTLRYLLMLSCLLMGVVSVNAKVSISPIFSDHMVLQRDMKIPVWGWGEPGDNVGIKFMGQEVISDVNKEGFWKLELEPVAAGGPYTMTLMQDIDEVLTIKDVMVGEVWICSGQSNMNYPLKMASNASTEIADSNRPNIRLLKMKETINLQPVDTFESTGWLLSDTASSPNISAIGYMFIKELQEKLQVPVGLIHTCWGGTPVESWTSREALLTNSHVSAEVAQQEVRYITDMAKEKELYTKKLAEWDKYVQDHNAGYVDKKYIWADPQMKDNSWKTIKLPTVWEKAGYRDLDGITWFRKTVEIPKAWAGKELTLQYGVIDDRDICFFNGVKIGATWSYNQPRKYKIPGDYVHAGKNVIAVEVLDVGGKGGFKGTETEMFINLANDSTVKSINLAGDWKYQIGLDTKVIGPRPIPPDSPYQKSVLFNTMIHPLIPYAMRGVIWNQGSANAARAYQYRSLFPLLIQDWRRQWNRGDFPFYFVQLPNYDKILDQPGESDWAELREAQAMALALPNTGMAVTIDIGDVDIHPRNKIGFAKRLALIARAKTYGESLICASPQYDSMVIKGDKIQIHFKSVGGGIVTPQNQEVKGFAIAGKDRKFYWAKAELKVNTVIVSSDKVKKPVAVRYAWANNPICNLYNEIGLPVTPFRTDDWPGITMDE